ncbi:MAG: hypothetical protein JJ902_21150 [Roseibium sp.]|nr:hypothetical protein [Roseibium sp.]
MAEAIDLSLDLPPLLSGHSVVPPMEPVGAAEAALRDGKAEAGDVFWSCDTDRIAVTVVLEPEVSRPRTQEMLFALMVAAADAVGALGPPELAFTWRWPNLFYANGARVGTAHLRASAGENEEGAPDWLLVGLDLQLKPHPSVEPGSAPDRTSLWDEGAVDLDTTQMIASLSRHFLTWLHRWESDGFRPIHEAWLFRCDGYKQDVTIDAPGSGARLTGRFLGLSETGDLVVKPVAPQDGEARSLPLLDHLAAGHTGAVPVPPAKDT